VTTETGGATAPRRGRGRPATTAEILELRRLRRAHDSYQAAVTKIRADIGDWAARHDDIRETEVAAILGIDRARQLRPWKAKAREDQP